ncbi:hypothetical protein ACWDTP_30955 [Mycobacterium sp. NPDC003449]
MASRVRRVVLTALASAALAAAPMGVATVVTPGVSSACQPGETGVIYGCAPFCVPGRQLDAATGLCLPVSAPPAPPDTRMPLI